MQINAADSDRLRDAVLRGEETAKPGFTRLNLSVLMEAQKVDYVLDSLCDLALHGPDLALHYQCDSGRAIFTAKGSA